MTDMGYKNFDEKVAMTVWVTDTIDGRMWLADRVEDLQRGTIIIQGLKVYSAADLDAASEVADLEAYDRGYEDGNEAGYEYGSQSSYEEGYQNGYDEGVRDGEAQD